MQTSQTTSQSMKKKYLTAILFMVFASIVPISCKKKNITYSFEGKITESVSGNPVSDVYVNVSQKIVNNGTTADGYTMAGSATTDANGNYSIVFDREKVTEFELKFRKDNFFPIDEIISSADITTGDVNVINKSFEPQSWVRFELFNSFPEDSDLLKLVTHNFREGCEGCVENTTTSFFGSLDTVMIIPTTAGQYVRFTLINSTGGFSITDSIYTTPFQTTTYAFEY